jgi:DNA-binding NarL/FixJ family response regulator
MRELVLLHLATDGIAVSATGARVTDPEISAAGLEIVLLCLSEQRWLDEVRAARAALPGPALIAIRPDEVRSDAARGLRAGVSAIVRQSALTPDLVLALWAVRAGMVCIPGALRESLQTEELSRRERQIVALVASGLANGAVAATLHVSVSTVKSHLSAAYAKLGVKTRKEAIAILHDADAGQDSGRPVLLHDASRAPRNTLY